MRNMFVAALFACSLSAASAQTQSAPITLSVDLTDAPRKVLHSVETLTVQPGPMTLVFPKWIPGEHAPDGPIDNNTGVILTTESGVRVKWERDPVDMFAYHFTVPAGATKLIVHMDFLATAAAQGFSAGASTSANLALLSWNSMLLYPDKAKAADVWFAPSLKVPADWKFGTALERTGGSDTVTFKPVTLEQLIDSPVLAGKWFREIRLAQDVTPVHYLDLAGDGPEDVALSDEHIAQFSKLVKETGALYASRHYGSYHFLVTLSDQVAHFGLEHHQSSDDRVPEKTFVDDSQFTGQGLLLPHEFTHSWNGKYRRPAGLATGDYQTPMKGDLLWVYEGLTEYMGDILAARCGIWSPEVYRARLATVYGYLNDARPGRTWRDLQDTATDAQVLYFVGGAYDNWRRNTDYYDEGELLWLEVDLTIRSKSNGKKSLNDFAAAFEGLGGNTGPKVVPYTFDDVVATLNSVVPNDWATFLRTRLDSNEFHAPEQKGLDTLSGYKLVYTDKPGYWSQLSESEGGLDTKYSLGMSIGATGTIGDTIMNGVAYKAGLAPGLRIVAVNGRAYTGGLMRAAIQAAKGTGPAIELIVENTGYFKVVKLDYHDGEKYPQLERVDGTPDRLDDILKPMTK